MALLVSVNSLLGNELNYYRENLAPPIIPKLADTLFEKTVWRRKLSHLVFEQLNDRYAVTLLMMERYPYNYKGQNYPIRYYFDDLSSALQKLYWLDKFLDDNGVLRVKIHGDAIIQEKVLYTGDNR